ncbi:MAG: type II secretion system F family protein [Candidatus Omnitrophica bacterium]|nr:type II secretion system F family protein [Candidatus Omnitrophota bacterium]MCB9747067.1 type II secretion system F family protein [Candidatus Omnitrophota bacterium]
MLATILLLAYLSAFAFVMGLVPMEWENRPTLEALGLSSTTKSKKKINILSYLRKVSIVNKPLCSGALRRRIAKDLITAHVDITPEEFILAKEILIGVFLFLFMPRAKPDQIFAFASFSLAGGYMLPEFWLKGKIKKVKDTIVKELPDAIDLLGLCVNAGLDFMLSLKWVVEKSPPSVMIDELNIVLQEINVGKTRRDAIKDLAGRYELPDLSTFARTLIQADKMGTSVTDALNILSEDMRLARYRRGEQLALKAPLKMLVPLLIFIFPVVAILVAGPILLDFIENNPFSSMGH